MDELRIERALPMCSTTSAGERLELADDFG
jgi:hypothetical protein